MTAAHAHLPSSLPVQHARPARLRLVASDGRLVGAAPRSPAPAVYRRRRLVAAGVLAAAVTGAAWTAATVAGSGGAPASSPRPRPSTYVVQPGDTLWSIAERYAGAGELPGLVERLTRANGGSTIHVGQALVMPGG